MVTINDLKKCMDDLSEVWQLHCNEPLKVKESTINIVIENAKHLIRRLQNEPADERISQAKNHWIYQLQEYITHISDIKYN